MSVSRNGGYDRNYQPYPMQLNPYRLIYKQRWSASKRRFVDEPLAKGADGIAVNIFWLWKGAERLTFRCVEVASRPPSRRGGPMRAEAVGEWLVAKETRFAEQLEDAEFHETMAKLQSRAQKLAENFNRRVNGTAEEQISFVQCVIYKVTVARRCLECGWAGAVGF